MTSSVTTIANYAFQNCSTMVSITGLSNVVSIGNYAFSGCRKLKSINLPSGLTTLGTYAFNNCSVLDSIVIPTGITSIPANAFKTCSGLKVITFHNGITSIGNSSFQQCGFVNLELPEGLETIGSASFQGCNKLRNLTIPASLTSVGTTAFGTLSVLESLTCRATVPPTIASSTFSQTSTANVTLYVPCASTGAYYSSTSWNTFTNILPYDTCANYFYLTSIGTGTEMAVSRWAHSTSDIKVPFSGNVEYLSIPNSIAVPTSSSRIQIYKIREIRNEAFRGYPNLVAINIGDSIRKIGSRAFYQCPNLRNVVIGKNVSEIQTEAFAGCDLNYLESKAIDAPTLGTNVFNGVSESLEVHIPCENPNTYYSSWNYFDNFATTTIPTVFGAAAIENTGAVYTLEQPSCGNNYALLLAHPAQGYVFSQWGDGSTTNPRYLNADSVTTDATTAYFILGSVGSGGEAPAQYLLSLSSNQPNAGDVIGQGLYSANTSVTIYARPFGINEFIDWSDGSTENPRTITITGNMTLSANFRFNEPTFNIYASSNNNSLGSVTGSGIYSWGDTATLVATPTSGNIFTGWNDGNQNATRTIVVEASGAYVANFSTGETPTLPTFTLTVLSGNANQGSVAGSGAYHEGDNISISAIPNNGFVFLRWNDNSTQNPRTISVSGNETYTAYFEAVPVYYTLTVLSNNNNMGTVTGSNTYMSGSNATITATANNGYHFDGW
ncbi:MAG: leucine-rich repeat protein, partial [Bacteroidales bacterium]|nr:leucine-rich repeat protein [Bacteroidales bacterium]